MKPDGTRWTEQEARAALREYDGVVRGAARRLLPLARIGRAMDEDDLIAEGRVAVLEALGRHGGYGIHEAAWVRVRVRQRMIDAIRRLDLRSRDEMRLYARHAAGETAGEEHERGRAIASRRMLSLDASVDGVDPLGLRLTDHQQPCATDLTHEKRRHERLLGAMAHLPDRQRQAIELGLHGMPLREIGDAMGISESRVCQLQKRAVHHLQRAVGELQAAA